MKNAEKEAVELELKNERLRDDYSEIGACFWAQCYE
jgi:hypothetical protein